MNSLKNEKDSLNTISSEVNSKLSSARGAEQADGGADQFATVKKNLVDKKSTIEECNRQAATFVRTVKVRVQIILFIYF